jgi:hypothetical protein
MFSQTNLVTLTAIKQFVTGHIIVAVKQTAEYQLFELCAQKQAGIKMVQSLQSLSLLASTDTTVELRKGQNQ